MVNIPRTASCTPPPAHVDFQDVNSLNILEVENNNDGTIHNAIPLYESNETNHTESSMSSNSSDITTNDLDLDVPTLSHIPEVNYIYEPSRPEIFPNDKVPTIENATVDESDTFQANNLPSDEEIKDLCAQMTKSFCKEDNESMSNSTFTPSFETEDTELTINGHLEENKDDSSLSLNNYSNSSFCKPDSEDSNDEFGDFQETKQTRFAEKSPVDLKNLSSVFGTILNNMFPTDVSLIDDSKILNNPNYISNKTQSKISSSNNILSTSVESSSALAFVWKNSKCRISLIKSLGIDTRCVHVGVKWHNPIFAADLGNFPIKPNSNKPLDIFDIGMSSSNPDSRSKNMSIFAPPEHHVGDLKKKTGFYTTVQPSGILNEVAQNKKMIFNSSTPRGGVPTKISTIHSIIENNYADSWVFQSQSQSQYSASDSQFKQIKYDIDCSPSVVEWFEDASLSQEQIKENNANNNLSCTKNVKVLKQNNLEGGDKPKNDMDVVVVTSTYSGSFKETHIFTPPEVLLKSAADFSIDNFLKMDSEKSFNDNINQNDSSIGIVIDETVVKKEYRDIEYQPKNTLETTLIDSNIFTTTSPNQNKNFEFDDDFSEFQSAPTYNVQTNADPSIILSPAILIPKSQNHLSRQSPSNRSNLGRISPDTIQTLTSVPMSSNGKLKLDNNTRAENFSNNKACTGNDDDGWTDFVSVQPKLLHDNSMAVRVDILSIDVNKDNQTNVSDNEEWSDFISSKPSITYNSLRNSTEKSISQTTTVSTSNSPAVVAVNSPTSENVQYFIKQYNRSL